jgi:phosphomannomutase
MGQIKFGTDGWRAVIAEDFTFANVERVTQAAADSWAANRIPGTQQKVVVGFDRRFLSDQFGERAAEVFAGNGYEVVLTPEPTPTPSVSFAVKHLHAVGGVMITASHNPPSFNGYKLKTHLGSPAEPSFCQEVEAWIGRNAVKSLPLADGLRTGQIRRQNVKRAHYAALKRLVNFDRIAGSNLRFAHEALFGVGAGCFDELLSGTSCRVTTLNGTHDPFFGGINPEPVERNYARSAAYLRAHPHDLCLVTDGDADRVGGMDGRGNYLSTHQLICLLLHHLVVNRKLKGRVVKALTTTSMVDKMCAACGLELCETGVGFKYIAAEMIRGGVLLGAEESGGIGFPGHIPERDGIAAGLMLLEMLATEQKPIQRLIAELERQYGPHRYGRVDAHFPLEKRGALMDYLKNNPPKKLLGSRLAGMKTYDGVKFVAEDTSWLMLRGSGTEPILRIYAEAASDTAVRKLLKLGVTMTSRVRTPRELSLSQASAGAARSKASRRACRP